MRKTEYHAAIIFSSLSAYFGLVLFVSREINSPKPAPNSPYHTDAWTLPGSEKGLLSRKRLHMASIPIAHTQSRFCIFISLLRIYPHMIIKTLRTEYRIPDEQTEFTNVVFEGGEGYAFRNDAFGNIVFDVETVLVEHVLAEFGAQILESHHIGGGPGPWAAPEYLREHGIKGFILTSSFGLSGWVLAREFSIVRAETGNPSDQPRAKIS